MSRVDRQAWSDFWAHESGGGQPSGCLPQGRATIEVAQRQVWTTWVRNVRKGGRLLDLATGDARLLRWLKAARPDLKLFGVDAAPALPAPPKGCKILTGTAMEQLPFADGWFDCITSQFGIEYGDTAAASSEIARVLKPHGEVALMVHRGDGPILAHNLQRHRAITWVLDERNVLGIAQQAALLPATTPFVTNRLAGIAAEGAHLFGRNAPAWEIAEAARRTLILGMQGDPADVRGTLTVLRTRADNEVARIESLRRACATADEREAFLGKLAIAGLELCATKVVLAPDGGSFADFIQLRATARR